MDIKKDGQFRLLSVFLFWLYAYSPESVQRKMNRSLISVAPSDIKTDLIPVFKRQRFTFDQAHHQRQQTVDDQVNHTRRAENHDVISATVQQLTIAHDFHQRDGVCQ